MTQNHNKPAKLALATVALITLGIAWADPVNSQSANSGEKCRENPYGNGHTVCIDDTLTWEQVQTPKSCRQNPSRNDQWCTFGFHFSEMEIQGDTWEDIGYDPFERIGDYVAHKPDSNPHRAMYPGSATEDVVRTYDKQLEALLSVDDPNDEYYSHRSEHMTWPAPYTRLGLDKETAKGALKILNLERQVEAEQQETAARIENDQKEARKFSSYLKAKVEEVQRSISGDTRKESEYTQEERALLEYEKNVNFRVKMENERQGVPELDWEAEMETEMRLDREFDGEDGVVNFDAYGGLPCFEGETCGPPEDEAVILLPGQSIEDVEFTSDEEYDPILDLFGFEVEANEGNGGEYPDYDLLNDGYDPEHLFEYDPSDDSSLDYDDYYDSEESSYEVDTEYGEYADDGSTFDAGFDDAREVVYDDSSAVDEGEQFAKIYQEVKSQAQTNLASIGHDAGVSENLSATQQFFGGNETEQNSGVAPGCSRAEGERYVAQAQESVGSIPREPSAAASWTLRKMEASLDALRRLHSRCNDPEMMNSIRFYEVNIDAHKTWMRASGFGTVR